MNCRADCDMAHTSRYQIGISKIPSKSRFRLHVQLGNVSDGISVVLQHAREWLHRWKITEMVFTVRCP